MQPGVSIANHELVLRIPADGIDPSWLYRPLDDLGIHADAGIDSVRIDNASESMIGIRSPHARKVA